MKNVEKINVVNEIIESRGYPTINILDKYEELNLDLTQDYYNNNHTNIHGSIKYTYYLSEYLIKNYGFKDKRNDSAYSTWNKGYKEYYEYMKPYVLDFELNPEYRNFDLAAPKDVAVVNNDMTVTVSWNKIDSADGYVIYRKQGLGSAWKEIGQVSDISFEDKDIKKDKSYYYTVVPFTEENGERYYGNYLYNGINIEV